MLRLSNLSSALLHLTIRLSCQLGPLCALVLSWLLRSMHGTAVPGAGHGSQVKGRRGFVASSHYVIVISGIHVISDS